MKDIKYNVIIEGFTNKVIKTIIKVFAKTPSKAEEKAIKIFKLRYNYNTNDYYVSAVY